MTQELFTIDMKSVNGDLIQTVNARDLHAFLENRDHFSTWIKVKIAKYKFLENQDFVTFSENTEKGRPRQEYALTIDMAKELSMVENNDKGREARQYFLACERQVKERAKIDYRDPNVIIGVISAQKELIEEMKPGYEAAQQLFDLGTEAEDWQCTGVRILVKELDANERHFVDWLLSGFVYRLRTMSKKKGQLMPRAKYDCKPGGKGWFRVFEDPRRKRPYMKVTPKGRVELTKLWQKATTPLLARSN